MILDLVFFAVIALMTVLGYLFGLFKTIVAFFGWLVCILIAYLLAKAVANAMLTYGMAEKIVNGKLFEDVYGLIPEGLKKISISEINDMLSSGQTNEQILEYVKSQAGGLVSFAFTIVQGVIFKDIYLNSSLDNVGHVLALELTYQIYVVLVGIAIFIVLRILVMGVSVIFGGKLRGRTVKLWERLGGLGLGAVRGFFYACLLVMVFGFIAGLSPKLKEQNDSSNVAVPVTNWINEAISRGLSNGNDESERYENLIIALEKKLNEEQNLQ